MKIKVKDCVKCEKHKGIESNFIACQRENYTLMLPREASLDGDYIHCIDK